MDIVPTADLQAMAIQEIERKHPDMSSVSSASDIPAFNKKRSQQLDSERQKLKDQLYSRERPEQCPEGCDLLLQLQTQLDGQSCPEQCPAGHDLLLRDGCIVCDLCEWELTFPNKTDPFRLNVESSV